jgi:hypothetical protein
MDEFTPRKLYGIPSDTISALIIKYLRAKNHH